MKKSNQGQPKLRSRLQMWRLKRRDRSRRKHTDWPFLFAWLARTSVAAAFFLASLGAFASCGWGIFSHLAWLPDPEEVPVLQNYKLYPPCVKLAVNCFKTLCAYSYLHCVILWLILLFILAMASSSLLNRLSEACNIRRYDA